MSFWRPLGPVDLRVYGATDHGRVRSHNEDSFLIADLTPAPPGGAAHGLGTLRIGDRGFLLLVADGMGGAAAGEVASSMAANTVLEELNQHWVSSTLQGRRPFIERMTRAVERANAEIHALSVNDPGKSGMGSTITVAGILGDRVHMLQVGDSRGYVVRKGSARQLTRDQSLTQHLVDVGQITESDAAVSDRRNVILQALGPTAEVEVAVTSETLRAGDYLILCSDGLSGLVADDELARVVGEIQDPAAIATELIDMANSRGGHDNITVIVAQLDGPGLRAP